MQEEVEQDQEDGGCCADQRKGIFGQEVCVFFFFSFPSLSHFLFFSISSIPHSLPPHILPSSLPPLLTSSPSHFLPSSLPPLLTFSPSHFLPSLPSVPPHFLPFFITDHSTSGKLKDCAETKRQLASPAAGRAVVRGRNFSEFELLLSLCRSVRVVEVMEVRVERWWWGKSDGGGEMMVVVERWWWW